MLRYLAIDPGGTTGWATWEDCADVKSIETGEIGPEEHHFGLWNLLDNLAPNVVIYERFQYRPGQSPTPAEDILVAREYIGILKLWCVVDPYHLESAIVGQTPAQAKKLWRDDLLKRAGLWVKGSTHKRDAMRHLLYYLTITESREAWVRLTRGAH